ncbi:hypothetical protein [Kitasatospora sp. NPDC085879]|uniref:hypothetical protein n=1 Tax=Kitasatospora sp. NPDC085879 TaxID=3154769 RepID=UPI00342F08EB
MATIGGEECTVFDRAFSRTQPDNGFGPTSDPVDRIRQDGIEAASQHALDSDSAEPAGKPNDPEVVGGGSVAVPSLGIEGRESRGTSRLKGDDTTVLDRRILGATWRPPSDYKLCGKSCVGCCPQEYGAAEDPTAAGRLRPGVDARSGRML